MIDGLDDGLLTVKNRTKWLCKKCNTSNHNYKTVCGGCHKRRYEKYEEKGEGK